MFLHKKIEKFSSAVQLGWKYSKNPKATQMVEAILMISLKSDLIVNLTKVDLKSVSMRHVTSNLSIHRKQAGTLDIPRVVSHKTLLTI